MRRLVLSLSIFLLLLNYSFSIDLLTAFHNSFKLNKVVVEGNETYGSFVFTKPLDIGKGEIILENPDIFDCNRNSNNMKDYIGCSTPLLPLKEDSDNDGVSDGIEELLSSFVYVDEKHRFFLLDPYNPDNDNDGLKDGEELYFYKSYPFLYDSDGDKIWDYDEVNGVYVECSNRQCVIFRYGLFPTENGDLKAEYKKIAVVNTQSNLEGKYFFKPTNPNSKDSDNDGIDDWNEIILALEYSSLDNLFETPISPDVDGDGLKDGEELFSYAKLKSSFCLQAKSFVNTPYLLENNEDYVYLAFSKDSDGDGVSDKEEIIKYHSCPISKDSDDDGLTDGKEVVYSTNLTLKDTDGDGLMDGEEVNKSLSFIKIGNHTIYYTTDPLNPDTDGDGLKDGEEVKGIPVVIEKVIPSDSHVNECGQREVENYTLSYEVKKMITLPDNPDSDGDGVNDNEDLAVFDFVDSDEDGLNDKEDPCPFSNDCDYDGLSDKEEKEIGTNPLKIDSDCDYLSDYYEARVPKLNPLNPDIDGDGVLDGEEYLYYNPNFGCIHNIELMKDAHPNPPYGVDPPIIILRTEKGEKKIDGSCEKGNEESKKVKYKEGKNIVISSLSTNAKVDQNNIFCTLNKPSFTLSVEKSSYAIYENENKHSCELKDVKVNGFDDFDVKVDDKRLIFTYEGNLEKSFSLFDYGYFIFEFDCGEYGERDVSEKIYLFADHIKKPKISFSFLKWDKDLNVGIASVKCENCNSLFVRASDATISGRHYYEKKINYNGKIEKVIRVVPIKRFCKVDYDIGEIYLKNEDKIEAVKTGKEIGKEFAKATLSKSKLAKVGYSAIAIIKSVKTVFGGIEVMIPEEEMEEEGKNKNANFKEAIKDYLIDKGVDAILEGVEKGLDKYEEKIRTKNHDFKVIVKACNSKECVKEEYTVQGYICD